MTANIFEIKRFAVHDGDGIRTTVFFKGCPLKCVWCHNPEGIPRKSQLAFYKDKCTLCRACADACPANAHIIENNTHFFDRNKCKTCGECSEACLNGALKLYGKEMTINELIPLLLKDKDFYDNSGGGITLSGGECLEQYEFCAGLLKRLKQHDIHTAVDTCGFVLKKAIDAVAPYTDIFLYDLKALSEDVHIKCTGQSNKIILENLKYIDSLGKKTEICIPFVPGYNDGELQYIADFLKTLKNITKVRVLPYHNFAGSKYMALDTENTLPHTLPQKEEIQKAEHIFAKFNI